MGKEELMKVINAVYDHNMNILKIDVVNNCMIIELPCGTPSNCNLKEFFNEVNNAFC